MMRLLKGAFLTLVWAMQGPVGSHNSGDFHMFQTIAEVRPQYSLGEVRSQSFSPSTHPVLFIALLSNFAGIAGMM
jgi:hypothetical protein